MIRQVLRVKRLLAVSLATLMGSAAGPAIAQDNYPSRLVKIVVPAPPGTVLDSLPRFVADKLAALWKQPVIIENRPGAAQNIGAEAVAKAAPDGYTLLATPEGPLVISQFVFSNLGFDPSAFVPVSIFVSQPIVVVANRHVPYSSLQEMLSYAKANPGKASYGSPGTGSSLHLVAEMLQWSAGVRLLHVPYKGMAPAMADLLAGHIAMTVDVLGNVLPHIRSGKLKALAVASEKRTPELPDVPAIAETFPGFNFRSWFAVTAPPNTPPEIAAAISKAISETLRLPDVAQRFRELSVTPLGTSPAETAAFLQRERERWRHVATVTNVRVE
jgi:tripartite-type tricarboxylate transporter receptor subunit TctC